jgi:hypothetical protein
LPDEIDLSSYSKLHFSPFEFWKSGKFHQTNVLHFL